MADSGIDDILIAYPLVGNLAVDRLARLAERISVSVAADSGEALGACNAAGIRSGTSIGFLVECDTGLGRLGKQTPEDATALALAAARAPGVRFAGLMAYPTSTAAAAFLVSARDQIESAGLHVESVSVGGTPALYSTHNVAADIATEVRAGEYIFGDRTHVHAGTVLPQDLAAVVRATVVGRPTATRAILDAGSKCLSSDRAGGGNLEGFGEIAEYPDALIVDLSEEHAHVDCGRGGMQMKIGDRVTIVPNHICSCVNLAGEVAVLAEDGFTWAGVEARGWR